MSKLIAVMVASLFAAAAFAQETPGQPPSQKPAGTAVTAAKEAKAPAPTTDKKAARAAKAKARQEKREAKVGDKPIN